MMRTALMTRTRLSVPLVRGFAEDKSMMDSVKETIGKATEKVAGVFKDEGSVGKQFQDTEDGAAASAAQKVADVTGAEALDKHGSIGKQFTDQGAVGGKVDEAARETQAAGKDIKKDGQH